MRTYFRMLAKVRRPSSTPSATTSRSEREQDHVGGGLRHAGGAVDREADIGRLERRRIVDAVAEEADDVAPRLQRLDQPRLLVGREPAIGVDRLDLDGERLVAQLGDIGARQDRLGIEPDQAGQPLHHDRIVARQDLDPDAGRRQPRNGRRGGGLGRIGEGAEPSKTRSASSLRLDARAWRPTMAGRRPRSARSPCSASARTRAWAAARSPAPIGAHAAPSACEVQSGSTASGAPLAISMRPSGPSASTDPSRRLKSKACRADAGSSPARRRRAPATSAASSAPRSPPSSAAMAPSRAGAVVVGAGRRRDCGPA